MEIVRPDAEAILAAGELFDHAPTREWTERFLASEGHHLLFARGDDGHAIGFVSGVELTHPDKGTEMFLYELTVHGDHRNRGIGRALVRALADLARENGCYGMWVLTDADNPAALAAYRAAGGGEPEPSLMLSWTFDT
jgi:ribosomal protein S18 acetylase RimI-like enzyme